MMFILFSVCVELNYTQQKDVRSRAVTRLLNLQPKLLLIERQNKSTQAEEPCTMQTCAHHPHLPTTMQKTKSLHALCFFFQC